MLEHQVVEVGVHGLQEVQPHRVHGDVVRDEGVANDRVVLLDGVRTLEVAGAALEEPHAALTVVVVEADVLDGGERFPVHDLETPAFGPPERLVWPPAVDRAVVGDLVVGAHDHVRLGAAGGVHVPRVPAHAREVMNGVSGDEVALAHDAETQFEVLVRSVDFAVLDHRIRAVDGDGGAAFAPHGDSIDDGVSARREGAAPFDALSDEHWVGAVAVAREGPTSDAQATGRPLAAGLEIDRVTLANAPHGRESLPGVFRASARVAVTARRVDVVFLRRHERGRQKDHDDGCSRRCRSHRDHARLLVVWTNDTALNPPGPERPC